MFGRFLQSRRENLPGPPLWVRAPGMANNQPRGPPPPPPMHGPPLRHHIPIGPFRLHMQGQGPAPAAIRIAIHQHVHPQAVQGGHHHAQGPPVQVSQTQWAYMFRITQSAPANITCYYPPALLNTTAFLDFLSSFVE